MADERNPDDRFRFNLTDEGIRRQTRVEDELQADPELAEGPASGSRITIYAIAIAVIVGTLFYAMNNTPIEQAGTSSTVQNAAPPPNTAQTPDAGRAAPNSAPGVTTGASPAQPQKPPSSMPTGQDNATPSK